MAKKGQKKVLDSTASAPPWQGDAAWRDHVARIQPLWADALVSWHRAHGRRNLPWRGTDPYRIWLSEVMLQQTQVATVIPYFERFIARWPTVDALAEAPLDEVMALWSGLGYYARARNLHRAAQMMATEWRSSWPNDPKEWAKLPGVGRSTAAAICAFAFGTRAAILDGNVERVLVRVLGVETPLPDAATRRALWAAAEALLPDSSAMMAEYTQAQMDLGALLCTRRAPQCACCPVAEWCRAAQTGRAEELPRKGRRSPVQEVAWRLRAYWWGDRLWWVQRSAPGIWGGLWALPTADAPPPPGRWQLRGRTPLPPHRLTHRLLHLTVEEWTTADPLCYDSRREDEEATGRAPAGRWGTLAQAINWGLPQPLRAWAEERLAPT